MPLFSREFFVPEERTVFLDFLFLTTSVLDPTRGTTRHIQVVWDWSLIIARAPNLTCHKSSMREASKTNKKRPQGHHFKPQRTFPMFARYAQIMLCDTAAYALPLAMTRTWEHNQPLSNM